MARRSSYPNDHVAGVDPVSALIIDPNRVAVDLDKVVNRWNRVDYDRYGGHPFDLQQDELWFECAGDSGELVGIVPGKSHFAFAIIPRGFTEKSPASWIASATFEVLFTSIPA
ncbi:hypothetical protein FJW07_29855 [Mesorhizobium sp. B3-1-9]|uniref:hypothetical protein n=1 Tax=Mesorhizobium sp. B3-1-9 TaxID=2589892 RepID=UPI00112AF789|nr:hypothetical protein [Mesorhizobium sp. B3-1-9]TPI29997.1 hypothetical protein FJW07_29855 [Mesorhizobium sp. B3-1-9]